MDTHAHLLHKAPGQGWKHYLYEFLMLFLAVLCGFLAENKRAGFADRQKEKQFIHSLCADLKSDTSQLNYLTRSREEVMVKIDSLLYYLGLGNPNQYGKFIYYYVRNTCTVRWIFYNNDRTIQQLKNSGNLRLIKSQDASDSIMRYDWEVRRNEQHVKEREELFSMEYIDIVKRLFDAREFEKMARGAEHPTEYPRMYFGWNWPSGNPHLVKTDKEDIQKLINNVHFIKHLYGWNIRWNKEMVKRASSLIGLLQKEYHLKDE